MLKKKITALLAALALCLTLLPTQALATDEPVPPQPPAVVEPIEPVEPEEPEEPGIQVQSEEPTPDRENNEH